MAISELDVMLLIKIHDSFFFISLGKLCKVIARYLLSFSILKPVSLLKQRCYNVFADFYVVERAVQLTREWLVYM